MNSAENYLFEDSSVNLNRTPLNEEDEEFSFFQSGRDFETAFTSHKYSKSEEEKLSKFESLDYLPAHSTIYKRWLVNQWSYWDVDRWIVMGLIGFGTGFLAFLLHQFVDFISEFKWDYAEKIYENNGPFVSWLFLLGFSMVCVGISSCLILLRPSAGGSGLPELIGFLNGTKVRHIFNIRTLIVKFFSCILAVSGGLPAGPEGPMIHMGSLLGAGISQFRSDSLGINIPIFTRFRNSKDRRDFISAGAAAGVASAFGAPVGGLLFSMEEVSSFWDLRLTWQTFFCTMISVFTTDILNSAFHRFNYRGSFGLFRLESYILFQVTHSLPLNILVFIPTLVLGILGGLMGGLFVVANLKIIRLRTYVLQLAARNTKVGSWLPRLLQLVEVLTIITGFVSLSVLLPSLTTCSPYTCASSALYSSGVSPYCLTNSSNPFHIEPTVSDINCPKGITVRLGNYTWTNSTFNQLATLLFTPGESALKHLFSRQTHLEFDISTVMLVLLVYMPFACWCAGSAVSSGLVVPMLFIGGLYGRAVGRLMVHFFGVHTSGYWVWIEPGAFSLIGAASFFGGVSRLSVALTVIMMEITNDIQYLLPIMVVIMVSKMVGDMISHPLYHAILELKCIPHLPIDLFVFKKQKKSVPFCQSCWPSSSPINLDLLPVSYVMNRHVVCLPLRSTSKRLAVIVSSNQHSAFPVVESEDCRTFLGLISRQHLLIYMQFILDNVSGLAYEDILASRLKSPESMDKILTNCFDTEIDTDLDNYLNKSSISVCQSFSMQRAFILVRSLGLRHLVVVSSKNSVVGIITRKDLMGFMVERRVYDYLKSVDDSSVTEELNPMS